jgi:Tfp pilus assembly protein PilF
MFSRIALVGLLAAAALACQSDPEKVAGFMSVGDEYVEAEQDREAVIEYRNALKIDPNHGGAHYGLAQAYLRLGRLKDGYWELRETVRLAPENLEARQRFTTRVHLDVQVVRQAEVAQLQQAEHDGR